MIDIKRFFLGPTVVEVAWEWRANTIRGDVSRYNLISSINTYITPFWKNKRIKSISEKDVNDFVRFLKKKIFQMLSLLYSPLKNLLERKLNF